MNDNSSGWITTCNPVKDNISISMPSHTYYSNLQRYLFQYADLVEQSNSLGLSNDAVDAENLFCAFLNQAFSWNLVNSNESTKNQDSFDLIEHQKGIAIQVTSNKNHAAKLHKTVIAFKKNKETIKTKRLIILFISRKCSPGILKEIKADGFIYEGYDMPKLLQKIYYTNTLPSQLKVSNHIIQEAISPVLIYSGSLVSNIPQYDELISLQNIPINNKGIYLERKTLIENIFSFCQATNGLIVGGPGVGAFINYSI